MLARVLMTGHKKTKWTWVDLELFLIFGIEPGLCSPIIRNSTTQGNLRNPTRAKGTKWKEGCIDGTCSGQESWVPGVQHGQWWQDVADCVAALLMMWTHLKVTKGLEEKSLSHYMKLRSNRALTMLGLTQSPRDYGPTSLPSVLQICKTEELGPGSGT